MVWRLAFLALFAGSNPDPSWGCRAGSLAATRAAALCAARAVSYTRHLTN